MMYLGDPSKSKKGSKKKEIHIIAHNVRSVLNVGGFFRTAEALGATKFWLTGYTPTPDHPRMKKVSLGTENWLSWERAITAGTAIKKIRRDFPRAKIVAIENNVPFKTVELPDFKTKFPLALVVGNEVKGITTQVLKQCDEIVEIPMRGRKESFNVVVALGIVLYQITKDL